MGVATFLAAPAVPAQAANEAVDDIVAVLRDRGLIDEATEQQILAKDAAYAKKMKEDAPLSGWSLKGDLRVRYEDFDWDDRDPDRRGRFRLRGRLAAKKMINERIEFGFRLATGTDHNSANQTFDDSFDKYSFDLDRLYVKLKLGETLGGKGSLTAGKMSNPFTWKNGKDYLLWDGDLNPEGFLYKGDWKVGGGSKLALSTGVFMLEEDSGQTDDPILYAAQLVGEHKFEGGKFGWRLSGYQYSDLDDGGKFYGKTVDSDEGNLINAFDDGEARIVEAAAYAKFGGGDWPVLIYGSLINNTTADDMLLADGTQLDEENQAYGIGVEFGSSKKVAKLGLGYFEVEANAVIKHFTDSDLFDGETNRKGWALYASKQVAKGTELKLTIFDGEGLEEEFAKADAERTRIQADVQFKF
ncbi:MAG: putative porin [Proteobacteria bacterium]|nr:putative porin [Pseudomonadota bacterium]